MDNGKATLFAKGTGLRALLERNGFEFFDYDEEKIRKVQETHRILEQKEQTNDPSNM